MNTREKAYLKALNLLVGEGAAAKLKLMAGRAYPATACRAESRPGHCPMNFAP